MIFEIPDVNLDSLSYAELKMHSLHCAHITNLVREYHMKVTFKLIHHENGAFASDVSRTPARPSAKKPTRTAAQILALDDDELSMDDFR